MYMYMYLYMYKLTTYFKDLPQQPVSSKRNLQVVDLTVVETTDCCGKSLRYVVNLYISLCLYDIEHSYLTH